MNAPARNEPAALGALADEIEAHGPEADRAYFRYHRARYARTAGRLPELLPQPSSLLDLGSHYLHQSVLCRALGHEVIGLDVPDFVDAPFIAGRAGRWQVENRAVADWAAGEFLPGQSETVDAMLFTETLEHLSFNPVRFWRRVYELLRPGGLLYLTTPNVYEFRHACNTLKRFLLGRGVGVRVKKILETVTYGHHWKLFSGREIREYFQRLSPDFSVEIRYYTLPRKTLRTRDRLQRIADIKPSWRESIEAVVRLPRKTQWSAPEPVD
jgi:2-polyprenyl-6-hydroxyphenyl methylase/3-demethylubiquinone-9 3-methyltransferase